MASMGHLDQHIEDEFQSTLPARPAPLVALGNEKFYVVEKLLKQHGIRDKARIDIKKEVF